MRKIGILLIIMCILLTGCSNKDGDTIVTKTVTVTNTVTVTESDNNGNNQLTENSLYQSIATDAPEDALLLIVNGANNVNYESANTIQTVTVEGVVSDVESMLLIPKYQQSIITIEAVEYNIETETVETKYELFNSGKTEDGYVLRFNAFRPEGAPMHKIIVTHEGVTIEYLVTYNGKDGNPTFEYVE